MKSAKSWVVGLCIVSALLYGGWWTVRSVSLRWAKHAHEQEVQKFNMHAQKKIASHGLTLVTSNDVIDDFNLGALYERFRALERGRVLGDSYGEINWRLIADIQKYCRRKAAEKIGENADSRSKKMNQALEQECKKFEIFVQAYTMASRLEWFAFGVMLERDHGTTYSREKFLENKRNFEKTRMEMEEILSRID